MQFEFILEKMANELAQPVNYFIDPDHSKILVNDWIGKELHFKFSGEIYCIVCGRKTKKAFAEGLCYPCFMNSPENSPCIIRPELCEAHLGKGRDMEWETKNHLQSHYVYLALTSAVKVGVTRSTNLVHRWIDQGAWKGIPLCLTNNRYEAGIIEVSFKSQITDKTNWQQMLKDLRYDIDLKAKREELLKFLDPQFSQFVVNNPELTEIVYPVQKYPTSVKSVNLEKSPDFKSTLAGIRGQYLIFIDNSVLNIRSHSGFKVNISVN